VVIRHSSGSTFEYYYSVNGNPMYKALSDVVEGTEREYVIERDTIELSPLIYDWANEIQWVAETPDLWAEMESSQEFIAEIDSDDSGNMSFTQDEQKQIAAQLQEITKQLKGQFELTGEQVKRIDEWRDEAVEATTCLGRKDWIMYLLGTITALTIAATVPAGIGEHLFAMVIHALGYLFTGGSEPPQILA
jgi:hypothetical protein